MCGVVGIEGNNVTDEDLEVLRRILYESQVRGRHASGIAYFTGREIKSYSRPVPIRELIDSLDFKTFLYSGRRIRLIAHARYSTSDLRYNLPLLIDGSAFVLNGVVTQEPYETWEDRYRVKCTTKNDSELLFRSLLGELPLARLEKASYAVLRLDPSGKLTALRNGLRPLYEGKTGTSTVYGSTYDILSRAGAREIRKIPCTGKERQLEYVL